MVVGYCKDMWQINFVCVFLAACYLSYAAPPDAIVGPRNQRLGSFNRYFLSTWPGSLMVPVANSDVDVDALTLDGSEQVAIVVHGRNGRAHSEFGLTLRNSLILVDVVVILVDWEWVSSFSYRQAAALVPFVASDLTDFISRLVTSNKLQLNRLHLIGFDLGAHVVGIASRNLPVRAMKITGLDPAGEGWDAWSERLKSTDAQIVEVIHTDGVGPSAFGIGEAIGTLDFFPNGGTMQPGCEVDDNDCYHNKAWQLYGATVDTRGHLIGFKCDNMMEMYLNRCIGVPAAVMGTAQLIKLNSGLYRVNTGSTYPYAIAYE